MPAKKTTKPEVVETEVTEVIEEVLPTEETVVEVAEATDAVEETVAEDKPIAKAGKRSAKAIKEKEAEVAKEERKANKEATPAPVKVTKARSKLERRSKKYKEAHKLIDAEKSYTLAEAAALAIKTSTVKFDGTVEIHVNLNVDPKQADQNIRETLVLPEGTGKTIRIAVFADADLAAKAKAAGADIAEADEFLARLEKGEIAFDTLIASPAYMAKLGKYARLLGPKGLMPNPKSGTVTVDVEKAVKEAKAGRVEFRVDSTGIIHVAAGKVSFGEQKLVNNLNVLLDAIKNAKPASVKGVYIKKITVTSTMGPGIKVDTAQV